MTDAGERDLTRYARRLFAPSQLSGPDPRAMPS